MESSDLETKPNILLRNFIAICWQNNAWRSSPQMRVMLETVENLIWFNRLARILAFLRVFYFKTFLFFFNISQKRLRAPGEGKMTMVLVLFTGWKSSQVKLSRKHWGLSLSLSHSTPVNSQPTDRQTDNTTTIQHQKGHFTLQHLFNY